ncbi:hypothetical protein ACJX0J_034810, partial [Zea mays]
FDVLLVLLLALYLFGDIGIGYSTGNGLSLFYIYMIAATLEIIVINKLSLPFSILF